ncbi:MAG TPA: shikimate dehydrogenase [Allosphingosinicella sp.]|jgi:shikimate dehydrogenase
MPVPYAEVIGDPTGHSKSPLIHKFWLGKLGLEGDYRAAHISRGALAAYFAERRRDGDWRGCNVTIPHKQAVLPLLDECRMWEVEAVNCVVPEQGRLIGHNTDMTGVGKAVTEGVDTWAPLCLIGAGGAARAAVAALDISAVYRFNVIARDRRKARALVEPFGEYGRVFGFDSAAEAMSDCLGLINASPLGMKGFDPMPEKILDSLHLLRPDAFVFDMVYAPLETDLLRRSAALGLRTVDGLTMLVGQAEHAFELFFGQPPPAAAEAELRELLAR